MCTFEEKRKLSRAGYGVRGHAIYKGGIYEGEIRNFSLNGFLFSSDETIDAGGGDKIKIAFGSGGEEKDAVCEISCTVVRRNNNLLGVKFSVIDYDTLMLLKKELGDIINDENRVNDEFLKFLEG